MKPNFSAQADSFYIENYNVASPFSSFFPGLAGETGKPMWLFYTNRGQCVSCFGINNKDGAMLEFLPANKAYQSTPNLGFRTFIKTASHQDWVEPFSFSRRENQQIMVVRPYELELRERDFKLGLEISVVYYGVPNENFPVLARSVTIKNISNKKVSLEILDGLPRVVPWGMNDFLVKHMSRTIEAFAEVLNVEASVPYFKLKIEPHDRPELKWLNAGFFSFGLNAGKLTPVCVDPDFVFGEDSSFSTVSKKAFSPGAQLSSNIMPCSIFNSSLNIKAHESATLHFYYGHAEDVSLADQFADKVKKSPRYFDEKRDEMKKIYENLVGHFGFHSSNETLNSYSKVTFMDNVLRGGFPVAFGQNGPLLHIFSRKHGDMERDYNSFQISATYYSQGNGNFRDVNQNRRHDLLLNSRVTAANVEFFFNLLQLDGYNPLVINPVKLQVLRDSISRTDFRISDEFNREYHALTREPVLAGKIYEFVVKYSVDPLNNNNVFKKIIAGCVPKQEVHHEDGFWTDHWIYNLDHLDQFLAVYPDKKKWLLFEKDDFTYFDSDHFVRPRREKYVITKEGELRQFNAVILNTQKQELIASRSEDHRKVRTEQGQGGIFKTNLFSKLIALAAVKISTLDSFGVGIEMEANKPGWCDAMNGCPALFGSSTHEMFELHRLVLFLLKEAIPLAPHKSLEIPAEFISLLKDIEVAFSTLNAKDFRPTWDRLASARENYREKVFFGVSGKTKPIRVVEIKRVLDRMAHVLELAGKKAIDPQTKLPTSYFTYAADASQLVDGWRQHLYKLDWKQHRVVPFLEGSVHAFKMGSLQKSLQLYKNLKKSPLADKKLGMYKLNCSLKDESPELGRIWVFSPGWLENEAIFLHMHYKYLLEILKAGLHDKFFDEIKTGIIAFRDPQKYGRSIFENSSFLASSSFPNQKLQGKGFVARLSGATSEYLSMVYFMILGRHPFKDVEGGAVFMPDPVLPADWFTKTDKDGQFKNSFSIRLFGVPVTILNPQRKNTFGSRAVKPVSFEWILEGRFHTHEGPFLPLEASMALREGRLESLSLFLGSKRKN